MMIQNTKILSKGTLFNSFKDLLIEIRQKCAKAESKFFIRINPKNKYFDIYLKCFPKLIFRTFSFTLIFSMITLLNSAPAMADLKLDSPDQLLARAQQNRQELRQVIIELNQQLPEMRDPATFESYLYTLDKLNELAVQFDLEEIYPGAVISTGHRMANFGVKWMDLTTFDIQKIPRYLRWFDNDSFASLLVVTNYILKTTPVLKLEQQKNAGENLQLIVKNYLNVVIARPDLQIGYRDTLSGIATSIILNSSTTESEKEYWFNRIYTSSGLALFLEGLQKNLYNLNPEKIDEFPRLFRNLKSSFDRSKELIDISGNWIKDRIAELSIELIKKSFECKFMFSKEQVTGLIAEFSTRQLQSLTQTLLSIPENYLIDSPTQIETLLTLLQPRLLSAQLLTDANNLDIFAGKSLAAIKIREEKREGTYKLTDKKGRVYFLTLASSRPLDIQAAIVDSGWGLFKNYFYFRYDIATGIYTGTYGVNETDFGYNRSLIRVKFTPQGGIEIRDEYAVDPDMVTLSGRLIEAIPSLHFAAQLTPNWSRKFRGTIRYTKPQRTVTAEMIVQSNGLNIIARLRDTSGPIYDFSHGFFTDQNKLILNTGRIPQTSWVQFRGSLDSSQLQGQFILGGRGIVTDIFNLKEVKE